MGRHVGRSRGCQVCRQRRIKCDEQTPECSQCLRSGKICPGPLQGTLFIDMIGQDNAKSVRDNKPENSRGSASAHSEQQPLTDTGRSGSVRSQSDDHDDEFEAFKSRIELDAAQIEGIMTVGDPLRESHQALRLLSEPSRTYPVEQPFYYRFISTFFNLSPSDRRFNVWVTQIPSCLIGTPSSVITYSFRAAAMAFYGKKTGDKALLLDACRWYAKGLESQRRESQQTQLQLAKGENVDERLGEAAIAAPILFSLFESIMCTSFAAWAHHMKAAGEMLELKGPEKCQHGIMHILFRSVRHGAVYIGLTFEQKPVFASEEWCTIPFVSQKTPLDRVYDILLQIPEAHVLRNTLRDMRYRQHPASESIRHQVQAKALQLLSWLDQFWVDAKEEIGQCYDHSNYREATNFQNYEDNWVVRPSEPVTFMDTFKATAIAQYDTAVILSNALAWEAAPGPSHIYKQRIVIHGASILAAIEQHEIRGIGSGGTIAMVLPMKVVARVTPSHHQREQAKQALSRWGKSRGVEGICKFGIPESEGIYKVIRKMELMKMNGLGDAVGLNDEPGTELGTIGYLAV